jgi:uridine kinase
MATRHTETFHSLGSRIAALPRRRATLLIGIDAPGGAGKSTFSRSLRRVLPTATLVAMDDFFLPSYARLPAAPSEKPIGGDFEWQRVQRQVLAPLACEQPAAYQRYDWDTDRLAEWHNIAPGGLVVVEGCYALHQALASYYDFTIWLECPRAIRVARGIARGGERVREIWEHDWMVAEDRYVVAQHPRDRATLVVDSSGTGGHDPEDGYVRLSL